MHRSFLPLACVATLVAAGAMSGWGLAHAETASASEPCEARPARVNDHAFEWYAAPSEDLARLDAWCRAVGVPVVSMPPGDSEPPQLEDLVVVSWNAHLAEGRLTELISDLRAGALTDGAPVTHFVLLLQELYRRGDDVPPFSASARSAFAIRARDPEAPDVRAYAARLGLSVVYVPSMRNGAPLREDRGNAIVSTIPFESLFALELPFERQRRVAAGAVISVTTEAGRQRLNLVDAHLEPLAAPSSLWILRNPRRRQIASILNLLEQPRFEHDSVGTVLGGDFNLVQGGSREDAYRRARTWSRSLGTEDPRATHLLGRLDYVFARLTPGWHVTTERVSSRYGSDHHPVLARFHR